MLPSNTAMVNLQWIMCRFDFVGGRCFCLRAISSPSTGVGHLLPRGSRVRILVAPAMSRPHQWFSTAGGEGADRCFGASAKRIPRVDTSSESDRAKSRTICSTKVSRSPGRGLDPGPRSVARSLIASRYSRRVELAKHDIRRSTIRRSRDDMRRCTIRLPREPASEVAKLASSLRRLEPPARAARCALVFG